MEPPKFARDKIDFVISLRSHTFAVMLYGGKSTFGVKGVHEKFCVVFESSKLFLIPNGGSLEHH